MFQLGSSPAFLSPLVQTSSWVDSPDTIDWILAYTDFTELRVYIPAS